MIIKRATSDSERDALDRLLWTVLWEPLGLSRDFRESVRLDSPEIQLVAVDGGTVVGGIVADYTSKDEVEVRHIAVNADYRNTSIGKHLIEDLIMQVKTDRPIRINTYARNTSVGFFTKVGFKPTGEVLQHSDFSAHGISFEKMYLEISVDN